MTYSFSSVLYHNSIVLIRICHKKDVPLDAFSNRFCSKNFMTIRKNPGKCREPEKNLEKKNLWNMKI